MTRNVLGPKWYWSKTVLVQEAVRCGWVGALVRRSKALLWALGDPRRSRASQLVQDLVEMQSCSTCCQVRPEGALVRRFKALLGALGFTVRSQRLLNLPNAVQKCTVFSQIVLGPKQFWSRTVVPHIGFALNVVVA